MPKAQQHLVHSSGALSVSAEGEFENEESRGCYQAVSSPAFLRSLGMRLGGGRLLLSYCFFISGLLMFFLLL